MAALSNVAASLGVSESRSESRVPAQAHRPHSPVTAFGGGGPGRRPSSVTGGPAPGTAALSVTVPRPRTAARFSVKVPAPLA